MRKIIIIFVLIFIDIILYFDKNSLCFVNKIDLNLKEKELAVSFIFKNGNSFVLIDNTDLIVIKDSGSEILDILDLYDIDTLNNVVFLDKTNDTIKSYDKHKLIDNITINNIEIIKKNNIVFLKAYEHNLCIYSKGENKGLEKCNYVFFASYDDVNIPEKVTALFFTDENLTRKFYDSWFDLYTVDEKNISILKLSPNDYNVTINNVYFH